MTQLVVTHDMESAYTIADRIAFFYKGRMRFIGTPDEIRTSDIPELQYFITGGRHGNPSRKTVTAIMRGKPPGLKSVRKDQPREETNEVPEQNADASESEVLEPAQQNESSIALEPVGETEEPPALAPEPPESEETP